MAEIATEKARGGSVWPVVDYANIQTGKVAPATLNKLRRRGCLVVRGHFPREQALQWDQSVVDYLESNRFFETIAAWGRLLRHCRLEARDLPGLLVARAGAGPTERPDGYRPGLSEQPLEKRVRGREVVRPGMLLYPDRIRRRPPGATSAGLNTHLDPGTLDLWMTENQKASGTCSTAQSRSTTRGTPPTARLALSTPGQRCALSSGHSKAGPPCRTWTTTRACCTPFPSPRPWHTSCSVLCSKDVTDDDMCGVTTSRTFPVSAKWHSLLLEALTGIPDVKAGDSVWWQCDMIHSVAAINGEKDRTPLRRRGAPGTSGIRRWFEKPSCPDPARASPAEHCEREWQNRFKLEDLNEIGRRGLGI